MNLIIAITPTVIVITLTDVTWHVAMDYGGVESTSRASRHEESTVKPEYLVVFCV